MIKREDWQGKPYEEMARAMQEDLVLYKDNVGAFTTIDECNDAEQLLMAEMDAVQERLKEVTYVLPKDVIYDGKTYSKKDITNKIVYFINKLEVKWENTLGLYQLVNMWKSESFEAIPYHVYDSTLRCLNQVTFKGMTEWTDILAVNEYLAQSHNDYSLDTGMLVYLSECHNAVVQRMDELSKPTETTNE